ncbi:MAG TPA: toll/interleukin-1 receptor domain-containing protein, partial [Myxococcus sp.]|nr:toll/interleukin-1 receptor domain-containing protein [Myxococcus sp.]
MARVFLSYASSDRAQARRLAEVLRRAGYSPILRVEEATGERLFDATKRVLEESDYVVVCLSQAALRSSWVQLEIAATVSGALEEEGRFFVVRWEAVGVPAALAQRPCVDLFPGEDAWHAGALQLVRVIERREEWRYGQDTLVRTQRLWMPSNLLPGPKHFVGRTAEMAAISEALTTGGPGTVLLHGPEGMGKTWLALEYAYRHRNEYLGGVWWIPASVSPAVTWARLFHVLREHGSPPIQAELRRVPESRPPSMLAAAVRAALATEPLPSLVILDAVGGRDWTQDLPGGAVRTLLTARERFHDSAVEVGALPADDALALADRVFGRKLSEEEARARKRVVLKLLAGHPAAIALAASLIDYERHVAGRVTLTGTPENRALKSAWKEGWRRYERRLAVETDSHPSRRGASSSEAVLDACVGLSIRGCSPEAHRFLRAYALFAPDQPSPIFIWLPTLAGLGETEDVHSQAERLRFELMDLGLLRRGRRGDFRWHEDDFLPRFVRERALAHTEAEPWREIATRGLRALEHRLAKGPGLVHIDEDLAHIQALLEVTDGVGNDADWTDAATRSATCFL